MLVSQSVYLSVCMCWLACLLACSLACMFIWVIVCWLICLHAGVFGRLFVSVCLCVRVLLVGLFVRVLCVHVNFCPPACVGLPGSLSLSLSVCTCMCMCMRVCVRTYVRMYLRIYAGIYVCTCTPLGTCVWMGGWMDGRTDGWVDGLGTWEHACVALEPILYLHATSRAMTTSYGLMLCYYAGVCWSFYKHAHTHTHTHCQACTRVCACMAALFVCRGKLHISRSRPSDRLCVCTCNYINSLCANEWLLT